MNKQQLVNKIWTSANKMCSKIEANEYKDYIWGFIFYKFFIRASRKIQQSSFLVKQCSSLLLQDKTSFSN